MSHHPYVFNFAAPAPELKVEFDIPPYASIPTAAPPACSWNYQPLLTKPYPVAAAQDSWAISQEQWAAAQDSWAANQEPRFMDQGPSAANQDSSFFVFPRPTMKTYPLPTEGAE